MMDRQQLEEALGCEVTDLHSRPGGDAAQAFEGTTSDGTRFFAKTVSSGSPFFLEALGLERLTCADGVRVPEVLAVTDQLLVLERIAFGSPGPGYQEELGRRLALTHNAGRHDAFGFDEDHWIGATPQKNLPWLPDAPGAAAEFWWSHRLEPMLRRLDHPQLNQLGDALCKNLADLFSPLEEPPCLIHGDLWSGNVGADQDGAPVMFDPAPSYSPREAELGMTKMFGGFTPAFYEAYDKVFPLKEGWRERQNLFMLYHVLNHAVLFGGGYLGQAVTLMQSYA